MAKMRSPNYPAIGLGEAIKSLQQVWDAEKRTAVGIDVLATAMGYKSVSGPLRTKVAAMRKYGLLDQQGGRYQVSQLGIDALYGQPDSHAQALTTAALRPESFRELFETHGEASDAALRSHLITRMKFSEAGASQFIKAFRETIALANPKKGDYIPSDGEESGEDMEQTTQQKTGDSRQGSENKQHNSRVFSWPVSKEVTAEVRFTGGNVSPGHLDRLVKYLELAKLAIESEEQQ